MIDWNTIKTEYITTDTSYRKLAEKYGISRSAVEKQGQKEGWRAMRIQHQGRTVAKAVNRISDRQAKKLERVEGLTDELLEKLERAIQELDVQPVKRVQKVRQIEYRNAERPDKPTKEIIHEEEQLVRAETVVDRRGVKQLASALRDLKEVQMLKSELDRREQEAKIAKLQRQSAPEAEAQGITVVFAGQTEECSQ